MISLEHVAFGDLAVHSKIIFKIMFYQAIQLPRWTKPTTGEAQGRHRGHRADAQMGYIYIHIYICKRYVYIYI